MSCLHKTNHMTLSGHGWPLHEGCNVEWAGLTGDVGGEGWWTEGRVSEKLAENVKRDTCSCCRCQSSQLFYHSAIEMGQTEILNQIIIQLPPLCPQDGHMLPTCSGHAWAWAGTSGHCLSQICNLIFLGGEIAIRMFAFCDLENLMWN